MIQRICTAALLLIPTIIFAGEPDKKLHNKCIYPTVIIRSNAAGGTAVVVKSEKDKDKGEYENIAFSAAHVFPENGGDTFAFVPIYKNWSRLSEYSVHQITIKRIDRKKDSCVIKFNSKEKVACATPNFAPKLYLGNEVYKVGCGNVDEPRLDYGKITSVCAAPRPVMTDGAIRTSIFTIPGDSGCGVFHEYELIGVTSCTNVGQQCITFCVPLREGFAPEDLK